MLKEFLEKRVEGRIGSLGNGAWRDFYEGVDRDIEEELERKEKVMLQARRTRRFATSKKVIKTRLPGLYETQFRRRRGFDKVRSRVKEASVKMDAEFLWAAERLGAWVMVSEVSNRCVGCSSPYALLFNLNSYANYYKPSISQSLGA